MTYEDLEESRYSGKPVECYRFATATDVWLWTSADRRIDLPIGTFEPETITSGEQDFSEEDFGESIEVRVPRTNAVASLFVGELPSAKIAFQKFRAHRDLLTDVVTEFTGEVAKARNEGSETILTCTGLKAKLGRQVPATLIQTVCNRVLYSTGCGANPTSCRDSILVTTVSGATIVSNDFALRADGWFNGGRLVSAAGETRLIVAHVGNTVTLMSAMPGLASLDSCWAYWGCDHLEAICAGKFSNLLNFLGWSRLPSRNPFSGRVDS